MNKKLFAFVLAAAMFCTVAFSVAAGSFADVDENAYYADAAERMAARGILSGYGDGDYHGDESVTRAHIAALVCKMLGKADEAAALAGITAFSDIKSDSWATGYVNYAHANGIIIGDGDGKFRPDDYVKYEEVVKVIVCVLYPEEEFEIDAADWSKAYLAAAKDAGLLKNLIGKKGEYMLRSDIAVICDAAMTLSDRQAAEATTTTTRRSVSGYVPANRPSETTQTTTVTTTSATTVTTAATTATTAVTPAVTTEKPEPVVTTAATTEKPEPVVTTAATTEKPEPVVTTAATTEKPDPVVTTATTKPVTSSTTKENMLPFIPFG